MSTPPSPSPSPPTSLLTIPFELRCLIYNQLLSGPNQYIISSSDRHHFYQHFVNTIPISQGAYIFPAANLLLVNRQLRSEIQPVIIEKARLYCSLTDFYDNAYCTRQLPEWLRTSLRHFSIYQSYVSSSPGIMDELDFDHISGEGSSGGEEAKLGWRERRTNNMQVMLAPPRHPRSAYVRRGKFLKALPALESVEVVYFWPEILGLFKMRLEEFYDGRRDDELLSLIKMAFRSELAFDLLVAERLVSGQIDGLDPDDIPEGILDWREHALDFSSKEIPANRVKISITAHFREMYPANGGERRCLVSFDGSFTECDQILVFRILTFHPSALVIHPHHILLQTVGSGHIITLPIQRS
jgi:hypothetical protein